MLGHERRTAAVLSAAMVVALAGVAQAAPEIYPLEKVHRGQTGYGMTTMAGTVPERFTFEVVSVMHNFLPKQDIILVKSDDPKVQVSGFWQGMSGSPLYIEDKLVCAFSYGFRFNKIALGGCTPLEYMKRDGLDSFRRGVVQASKGGGPRVIMPAASTMADWQHLTNAMDPQAALDALGPARRNWLLSAPLPAAVPKPGPIDGETMTAAVPLAVAGFSAPAFAQLAKVFDDSDVTPMRAGGAGGSTTEAAPPKLVMGGTLTVELIRGDMSAAAYGTVSYIDGDKVLAFGHPMFQTGETYAPIATAITHTVIPSSQSAFLLASAGVEVGTLVQDRQAAIMADTSLRTHTIPVDIEIASASGKHSEAGSFHVELLDNKFLTPAIAGAAVMNAINYYLPDRDDVTARIESTVRIKGGEPLTFVDYLYANDGAASVMGAVRGLRVLVPLMLNPFGQVDIERIDLKIDLKFEANYGELKEVTVPTGELIPGVRNTIHVRMQGFDGKDIDEDLPVDVPESVAGGIVQLEVSAGDAAKLDAAPPVDLPSLISAFRKLLPGNVWAASIYPADAGVALDG